MDDAHAQDSSRTAGAERRRVGARWALGLARALSWNTLKIVMRVARLGKPWGRRARDRKIWLVWHGLWVFGGVFAIGLLIGANSGVLFDAENTTPRRAAAESGPTWESISEPVIYSETGAPAPIRPLAPRWERYAVAAPEAGGRPMIAVVIDDVGVDAARSARAIALRAPLTMAFLPYARGVAAQAARARDAGHELIVHVPMEPGDEDADPGPRALVTGLGEEELAARLGADLAAISGYVGISNHMGSRFTRDERAMAAVMRVLSERGLLFLDSRTGPATVGAKTAARFSVPFAERDVFLDNQETLAAVRRQLATAEEIARRQGHAVAIGHPKDATLAALAAWLNEVEGRGFVLVPLSAVVRAREVRRAAAE